MITANDVWAAAGMKCWMLSGRLGKCFLEGMALWRVLGESQKGAQPMQDIPKELQTAKRLCEMGKITQGSQEETKSWKVSCVLMEVENLQ